jgi:DNA-nicking Smr family endonuclease
VKGRGRRQLAREERELWLGVARTVVPLAGRAPPGPLELPPPAPTAPAETKATPVPAATPQPPRPPRPAAPPALHPIERPVRRKLAKGRLPIDGRIDLHDRTEAVAHGALLAFLRGARGEGLRHVLVITGRGSSPGSVGALKRALPHWLATPDFRALVAGFEPAGRAHGGEGAFYLRLRRR